MHSNSLMYRKPLLVKIESARFARSLATTGMHQSNSRHQNIRVRDEAQWSSWMVAAQRGDEVAYGQLLNALGDVVAAYLRSRFGPLNFLEDCVQESLLAIHQARHTYDGNRPFRPWMFTIVRHKVIDYLRSRNRHSDVLSLDDDDQQGGGHMASDAAADELLAPSAVFGALSPTYREALILTKILGLSAREASRKLKISEAAMKVRVHRALQALREQLEVEQ